MNLPIVVFAMQYLIYKVIVSRVGDSEWPHLLSDASNEISFVSASQLTSWFIP